MLGSIIGGALDFIGQSQTNQKNWDIAQAANAASAEQAQKQMDFQERMRKTQYQTAVEDMKASGLNPMLAYTQGGAGVPTGAMGSVSTAQFKSPISSARTGAMEIANTLTDIEKKDAETTESVSRATVNEQQAKYLDAQTNLAVLEMPNVPQKLKNMISEQMLNDARKTATHAQEAAAYAQTALYGQQTKTSQQEYEIRHPEHGKSKTWWGKHVSPYLKDFQQGASSAASAAYSIK